MRCKFDLGLHYVLFNEHCLARGSGYVLEAKSAEDDLVRRITNGIIIQKGDMKRV